MAIAAPSQSAEKELFCESFAVSTGGSTVRALGCCSPNLLSALAMQEPSSLRGRGVQ